MLLLAFIKRSAGSPIIDLKCNTISFGTVHLLCPRDKCVCVVMVVLVKIGNFGRCPFLIPCWMRKLWRFCAKQGELCFKNGSERSVSLHFMSWNKVRWYWKCFVAGQNKWVVALKCRRRKKNGLFLVENLCPFFVRDKGAEKRDKGFFSVTKVGGGTEILCPPGHNKWTVPN